MSEVHLLPLWLSPLCDEYVLRVHCGPHTVESSSQTQSCVVFPKATQKEHSLRNIHSTVREAICVWNRVPGTSSDDGDHKHLWLVEPLPHCCLCRKELQHYRTQWPSDDGKQHGPGGGSWECSSTFLGYSRNWRQTMSTNFPSCFVWSKKNWWHLIEPNFFVLWLITLCLVDCGYGQSFIYSMCLLGPVKPNYIQFWIRKMFD